MKHHPDFRTESRIAKTRSVVEKRQKTLTVVLENINDPHNVSAVLRSCDAAGIFDVHLVYHGSQPFPKLGEKSSASARKWVNCIRHDTIEDCYTTLRSEGKKIYTTNLTADSVSIYDLDLTEPVALVLGNEHAGVSPLATELADKNFLIPQVGMIQSLNISVAAAVSIYEAFRQRLAKSMYDKPEFNENELEELVRIWLGK